MLLASAAIAGCPPHASHVLARDAEVVVYDGGLLARSVEACTAKTRVTLARASGPGPFSVGRVALSGAWVAFAAGTFGVDSGCTSVYAVEVAPSVRRRPPRVAGCTVDAGFISSARVDDLLVSPHGSVAWVLASRHRGSSGETFAVVTAEGDGPARTLESAGAQPGSLRLTHGRLRWRDAHGARSARLT